jgi:hypothetical protein
LNLKNLEKFDVKFETALGSETGPQVDLLVEKPEVKNLVRLSLLFEFAEFFEFKADPSVRPPPGDLLFIQARVDLKKNCYSSWVVLPPYEHFS